MPIVQVRSTLETGWLTAPYPPFPNLGSVLSEWQNPMWNAELLVYPPGYMGNISPEHWRPATNFLLHVDSTGESAQAVAMGELSEQQTIEHILGRLGDATPEDIFALGTVATIDEFHQTTYISAPLRQQNALAIGGAVLYADAEGMTALRSWFPEAVLQ